MVAGAAIETARLLLNSKSRLFPNGAGNSHDWVGRNLQGHAYAGATGLFARKSTTMLEPGPPSRSAISTMATPVFAAAERSAMNSFGFPTGLPACAPRASPRWGKAHKDFQRALLQAQPFVQRPVQEMPVFTFRVQADPRVKDYWGIPVARLSGNRHPDDLETGESWPSARSNG